MFGVLYKLHFYPLKLRPVSFSYNAILVLGSYRRLFEKNKCSIFDNVTQSCYSSNVQ